MSELSDVVDSVIKDADLSPDVSGFVQREKIKEMLYSPDYYYPERYPNGTDLWTDTANAYVKFCKESFTNYGPNGKIQKLDIDIFEKGIVNSIDKYKALKIISFAFGTLLEKEFKEYIKTI